MEHYIGVKTVQAEPHRHYDDGTQGFKIKYPDGYESWSPKEVFEESYQMINGSVINGSVDEEAKMDALLLLLTDEQREILRCKFSAGE